MGDILVYPGFTSSEYDGNLWVATVNNSNLPKRVLMSKLLEADGVTKYPHASGWDLPASFRVNVPGAVNIGKGISVEPYFYLDSTSGIVMLYGSGLCMLKGTQVQIKGENTVAGYTLALYNDSGAPTRRAAADTWAIYPSFAADKDDLAPINEPLEKSTKIRGYEYSQQESQQVGFTIDDIEAHYPAALEINGKNEITGYNPNALLALLFESNRLLEERVSALEAQKG